MEVLYALNLALAVLLLFWPVWFSRRKLRLPLINPFTIAMVISVPIELMKLIGGPLILIDEGLFDVGYQYGVLASNVLTVCQVLGVLMFFRLAQGMRLERYIPMRKRALSASDLRRVSWFFLLVFALAFYLLASAEFGVAEWIANPREGYQLHRTGQGHWFALAISALAVSMLASQLARPTAGAVLLRFPLYVVLAYLLGSKAILLNFFIATFVVLWFIRWKHLTLFITVGIPALFGLMLFNLYLALADTFELQTIVEYFDYYKNAAMYYNEYLSGKIDLFWGDIWLSSYASYIPRALWPDKPTVYGIVNIIDYFYPGSADLTNTPAFGGAVEQFSDFGFFSVALYGLFGSFSFLTGVLSYLIFRRPGFNVRAVTVGSFVLVLIQFVPAFGTFFPGALYGVLLVLVMIVTRILRGRKRKARRTPPLLLELERGGPALPVLGGGALSE